LTIEREDTVPCWYLRPDSLEHTNRLAFLARELH